jgi:hypothetical protein
MLFVLVAGAEALTVQSMLPGAMAVVTGGDRSAAVAVSGSPGLSPDQGRERAERNMV